LNYFADIFCHFSLPQHSELIQTTEPSVAQNLFGKHFAEEYARRNDSQARKPDLHLGPKAVSRLLPAYARMPPSPKCGKELR